MPWSGPRRGRFGAPTRPHPPPPVRGAALRAGTHAGTGDAHTHSSPTCRRGGYPFAPAGGCRTRTHTATRDVPGCGRPALGRSNARSDNLSARENQSASLTVRVRRAGQLGSSLCHGGSRAETVDRTHAALANESGHVGVPEAGAWSECHWSVNAVIYVSQRMPYGLSASIDRISRWGYCPSIEKASSTLPGM